MKTLGSCWVKNKLYYVAIIKVSESDENSHFVLKPIKSRGSSSEHIYLIQKYYLGHTAL